MLTLEEAKSLIEKARESRPYAYVMMCLLTGCRTEEARALRWDRVDLDGDPDADPPVPPHVAVWRSVREQGVPVEEIAHLVGHSNTSTTETVYRMELRPVIGTGAEIMDNIFRVD